MSDRPPVPKTTRQQNAPAKVVISGATGRMGQTLAALIETSAEWELVGGIDRDAFSGGAAEAHGFSSIVTAQDADRVIRAADVVLDFSAPEGLANLLARQTQNLAGKVLVVGTTGLSPDGLAALERSAQHSAVMLSANYSVGVNLMLDLVANAARVLPAHGFDVEIVETHHRHKADAPSGTALLLGKVIAEARGMALEPARRDGRSGKTGERAQGEIAFHALRGGEVVGEHRVLFLGAHQRFEIAHAAADRGLFAEGALLAARWLMGKPPGRYTMKDVLGL
ncbi:MAG: 4-hydroxy-tetrahydrodipicolinate reductase [Longimicrobiales bacterium]